MMKKYEYLVLQIGPQVARCEHFNNFGASGWKLVAVDDGCAYFMREKIENELLAEDWNERHEAHQPQAHHQHNAPFDPIGYID
jgi:hypothetical protein